MILTYRQGGEFAKVSLLSQLEWVSFAILRGCWIILIATQFPWKQLNFINTAKFFYNKLSLTYSMLKWIKLLLKTSKQRKPLSFCTSASPHLEKAPEVTDDCHPIRCPGIYDTCSWTFTFNLFLKKGTQKKNEGLSLNRALLGQSGQNMIQRTFCHDQNYKVQVKEVLVNNSQNQFLAFTSPSFCPSTPKTDIVWHNWCIKEVQGVGLVFYLFMNPIEIGLCFLTWTMEIQNPCEP